MCSYLSLSRGEGPGSPGRGGKPLLWRGKVLFLGTIGQVENLNKHLGKKLLFVFQGETQQEKINVK